MPVRIEPNAEPIPGYRLIERLGGGGFGEVWKAEAPGGLLKAIKFVYGDLHGVGDDDASRAEQELKALARVRSVRHPYILSIERFDIIDGQLLIVTELADRTLWDRFRECRSQGLLGIPREELLSYMDETAEALDLMNEEYQLQHLDIKPQNLFLVHNHIKVADFGLAKDLGDRAAATVTGGVTPVYAAPETFDGWLTRFSDQYSLAIVFQELLTGQRPFSGNTVRQLVLAHLQGSPDLSMLSVADRRAVSRALSKKPEDRFPTCHDFVNALREASGAAAVADTGKLAAPLEEPPEAGEPTIRARAGVARTKEDSSPEKPSFENRPQVLPPRPREKPTPKEAVAEEAGHTETSPVARRRAEAEEGRKGLIQPSLIVGLGRIGLLTLQRLRKVLNQEFGHPDALPHVRFLGLDTDPETLSLVTHGDFESLLRPQETVLTRLHRASHYLKTRDSKSGFESWLNPKLLYRIPRQQNNAGLRPLGRLAFVDNYRPLSKRLEMELEACVSEETLSELSEQTDLGVRNRTPRVYLVTCLGGSTGGGMFLDVAYVLRSLLRKQGHPHAEIVGVLLLPAVEQDPSQASALANCYAALTELNHFSAGQVFTARYGGEGQEAKFTEAGPPFQRTVLLNLPPRKSAQETLTELLDQSAQWIYREVATDLGVALDETRRANRAFYPLVGQAVYQSIGLYRVLWPRRQILQQAARNVCRRLVERWMSKDAKPISQEVRTWAQEQWDNLGLRAESLIARHQERLEKSLGEAPDRTFRALIEPLTSSAGGAARTAATEVNYGPAIQVMDQLEKLLGVPEEARPPGSQHAEPGTLEEALSAIALLVADEAETRIAQAVVQLIEQPRHRLAGAEEGLRQFYSCAEQALQAQEQLAKELHDRAVLMHARFKALLEVPANQEVKTTSLWKFSRKQTSQHGAAEELVDLLKGFAKARYQSLVLYHVNRLYVSLRGHLSDQIREIGFCRQRLSELAGLFADKPAESPAGVPSEKYEEHLLVTGAARVEDAIQSLEKQLGPDDMMALDQRAQTLIQNEFRALVQVCLGPSHVVKNLAPALQQLAENFLEPRLEGGSVAEIFVQRKGRVDAEVEDALKHTLASARPPLGAAELDLRVMVLPNDTAGKKLQSLLVRAAPDAKMVATSRRDEIVCFAERTQVFASELPQFGPAAEEVYRQRSAADPGVLHTREDIDEWRPDQATEKNSHS